MKRAAPLHRICFGAAALLAVLAGAAQAQTADFDEHGRPSLFPLQASWWAPQTDGDAPLGGNTPGRPRAAAAKPVEPTKPKVGETRSCATDAARPAKKGSKAGPTPCPAAK